MLYLLSIISSFCAVFLKGFQTKNVIHERHLTLVFTSFLMAAFDVLTTSIIVFSVLNGNPWLIILTSGTGAAAGMLSAMYFHEKFFAWLDEWLKARKQKE